VDIGQRAIFELSDALNLLLIGLLGSWSPLTPVGVTRWSIKEHTIHCIVGDS